MVNKIRNIKNLFLPVCAMIACISLLSCKYFMTEKKYKYDTAASCEPGYGIYLHTGAFKSPEGEIMPIYNTILSGPLGVTGSPTVIGDGFNPIPNVLRVGFYSETENKFYEGEFNLPYEQLQKMFEEESDNPSQKNKTFEDTQSGKTLKYMKYNVLSIGVTLGGKVTLWINGENRNQIEVAHFQANETQKVIWSDVFENGTREESFKYNIDKVFSEKVKNEVLTKTLPFNLWDSYGEKYNWSYKIEMPTGGKVDDLYMKMINAEAECIYDNSPTLDNDPGKKRAIPYNLEIRCHDAKGRKYLSWIVMTESDQYLKSIYKGGKGKEFPEDFREEEIYKVFQSLDKAQPIVVIFRVNETYEAIKIYIKQGDKEIPLKKINAWFMSDN